MREPPGDAEREHVARDLGRRTRGEAGEIAQQYINGDERRAQDEDPAGDIVHHRRHARRCAPHPPRDTERTHYFAT
jgi:hypothetical protein